MVHALNYAAQASRDLKKFIINERARSGDHYKRDLAAIADLIRLLEVSQHFQLPEGGHIFHDRLKGLKGREANLPYPAITVCYHIDKMEERDGGTFDGSKLIHVPKRLALAQEIPITENSPGAKLFPGCKRVCQVSAVFGTDDPPQWNPCMAIALIPMDKWDGTGFEGPTSHPPSFMKEPSGTAFMGRVGIIMPGFFYDLARAKGDEFAERSAHHDIGGEAAALLELCEALSCSNVHEETIQRANPGINARRARDGKLPLWETKILSVTVPKSRLKNEYQGGTHASPKFHLCSGHIRGLPGGGGNIWIQDYARGDRAKGTVTKSYRVRTSA